MAFLEGGAKDAQAAATAAKAGTVRPGTRTPSTQVSSPPSTQVSSPPNTRATTTGNVLSGPDYGGRAKASPAAVSKPAAATSTTADKQTVVKTIDGSYQQTDGGGTAPNRANAGGYEDMVFPAVDSAPAPFNPAASNEVDPYAGYNVDPVTDANYRGANNPIDTSSRLPKDLSTLPDKIRQLATDMFGSAPRPAGSADDAEASDQPSYLPDMGGGTGATGGSRGGGGSSGGGSSGGGSSNGTGYTDAELLAQALRAAGVSAEPYQLPTIDGPNPERVEHVDTTELRNLLQQIMDSQAQQGGSQIDYTVEQGVNALNRAMEDAALQYQTQRDQATADELRALDNQALYAEARGDRGGIGEAQYGSIQAAAAQNRRAVNDAQVKLGTDTARQIADLRAQGEFQKADQLLSLTQNYLSQLMGLEQWALEANLGVDEFNSRLQQWVDEYNLNVQQFLTDLDLSAAQLTGVFSNGNQTAATRQRLNESLASSGSALLSAGILPSRQQLEAMGMTETQAKAYIRKMSE